MTIDGSGIGEGDLGVRVEVHRSHFADRIARGNPEAPGSGGAVGAPTRPSCIVDEGGGRGTVKNEERRLTQSLLGAGQNPTMVGGELVAGNAHRATSAQAKASE